MPPSAIEIKARLDKAVDQEGNVLDMEAVLEIIASLERIVMTKESLEATRIGKTINMMRKRTTNADLSKRAKKLVKRWQTLVSNHYNIKPENLNGVIKRKDLEQAPASVNGNKIENDPESKNGTKRKRGSPDNFQIKANDFPTVKPGMSPRLVQSPKRNASPKPKHYASPMLGSTARQGSSPGLSSPGRGLSPKVKSKTEMSKPKQSSLVVEELNQRASINVSATSTELQTELNCSDFLNHTQDNNNVHINEQTDYIEKHNQVSKDHTTKHSNDIPNKSETDGTVTNSTDTRIQEDRISLNESLVNNIEKKETTNFNTCKATTDSYTIPKEFPPIEPEDLKVIRRELPEDVISPESESDGVNGVYNSTNVWCPWEDNVQQRDNELLLLPYVILD